MSKLTHIPLSLAAGLLLAVGVDQRAMALDDLLGNIDYVAFSFAPKDWAKCDGQLLPISQNQALFSLLGTTFGGDGRTTFALPDMRGRSPMHAGTGGGLSPRSIGEQGGQETVTLTPDQVPRHTHTAIASNATGNQASPTGNTLANDAPDETYVDQAPNTDMSINMIGSSPSNAHDNMAPFTVLNCIIALKGIFPSRN